MPAAASIQAVGQVSEIGFLLALPFFFRTVGIKGVLILGMLGWAARYLLFAHAFTAAGPVMPLVTWGVGSVIGSLIAKAVYVAGTAGAVHDWARIWTAPAALALIIATVFALAFRERRPVLSMES